MKSVFDALRQLRRCNLRTFSRRGLASTRPFLEEKIPLLQARFDKLSQNQDHQLPLYDAANTQSKVDTTDTKQPQAAVLVWILTLQNQPTILFTKRSSHLSNHPSEISFPGGHYDAQQDDSLIDTALRETLEEIHASPRHLHIVGSCQPLPSLKGTPVTAILGVDTQHYATIPGRPNPEVETVFGVSIRQLLRDETTEDLSRFGYRRAPVFPCSPHGKIWGLTAYLLQPILHKLLRPVLCPDVRN